MHPEDLHTHGADKPKRGYTLPHSMAHRYHYRPRHAANLCLRRLGGDRAHPMAIPRKRETRHHTADAHGFHLHPRAVSCGSGARNGATSELVAENADDPRRHLRSRNPRGISFALISEKNIKKRTPYKPITPTPIFVIKVFPPIVYSVFSPKKTEVGTPLFYNFTNYITI